MGILHGGTHIKADCVTIGRAMRERWPVTAEARQLVVDRLVSVLEAASEDRDVVNASRALIAADGLNVTEAKPPPISQRLTLNQYGDLPPLDRDAFLHVARVLRQGATTP